MFSVTAVIVGLFISADFGLCDRFRCRGLLHIDPRERTGNATHWFWTIAYILGLGLWTLFYIFLEESFSSAYDENVSPSSNNQPSQVIFIKKIFFKLNNSLILFKLVYSHDWPSVYRAGIYSVSAGFFPRSFAEF